MITTRSIAARRRRLHPVLAELVGAGLLEPLAETIRILFGAFAPEVAALLEHQLLHEDLGVRAQGERDRVARPAVHREGRVAADKMDAREKRVLAQLVDDDALRPGGGLARGGVLHSAGWRAGGG